MKLKEIVKIDYRRHSCIAFRDTVGYIQKSKFPSVIYIGGGKEYWVNGEWLYVPKRI